MKNILLIALLSLFAIPAQAFMFCQPGGSQFEACYYEKADWNQSDSGTINYIQNKPTMPTVQAYEDTTQRLGAFPVFKSVTVASGNAVAHFTDTGLSGGTALCPNGLILNSVQMNAEEGTSPHAFGTPALSNGNKTLTVSVSKLALLLGILTLNQSANGSTVRITAWCK